MLYVWCVRGGFLSGRNDRVASGRGALFRGRKLLCLVRARRTGAGCAVIRSSEQVGHSGRCGWCPPAPLLPGADSPREHLPIYKSAMDLAVHLDKVVKKIVRWRRRCFADCTDPPGSGHSRGPHRVELGRSREKAGWFIATKQRDSCVDNSAAIPAGGRAVAPATSGHDRAP
jgi:hypothetical protein